MGRPVSPRHGSMQFWPRSRAKRPYARINAWAKPKDSKVLGFAGYKAGMTTVQFLDTRKNSPSKNETLSVPCTIIECPPLKIFSLRFYKYNKVATEIINPKLDKEIERKISVPKKEKPIPANVGEYDELRINVYTQPKLTGIGKKKPELFELRINGNVQEQLDYVKSVLDKEIKVEDVFKAGQLVDAHSITTGKGYQGPVKRFGIRLKHHKSEKGQRRPGVLSAWGRPLQLMYRAAYGSKMGFHMRTDYNKYLFKISNDELKPIDNYGIVKNTYVLVKGSVPGPQNRLITLVNAIRPSKRLQMPTPELK